MPYCAPNGTQKCDFLIPSSEKIDAIRHRRRRFLSPVVDACRLSHLTGRSNWCGIFSLIILILNVDVSSS